MAETFYSPPTETDRKDRASWHIGRIFGIPTRIHFSFVLVLIWLGISYWTADHSGAEVLIGLGLSLAVFACVLLHEFGHALVAKRFGIRTRRITLWPIGGVAELERSPDDPRAEMWIAAAGPLVNFAIAALLAPLVFVFGTAGLLGNVLFSLLAANLMLGLFNLIPAFPMDGGRVVRAMLERKRGRVRATEIAAKLGRWVALAVGLWGLWNGQYLLMLVAAFVYFAARRELWQVQQLARLEQERMAGAQWTGGGLGPRPSANPSRPVIVIQR